MKLTYTLLFSLALSIAVKSQTSSFHDYSVVTIQGDTISLSQFYGKKVMVVNTASACGFTPQFEDLQQLYLDYNQNNFEIVGFPCNDFNNQDPHSDSAILVFCQDNYNVTFPMMSKVQIVTGDTAPVYKWLQRADLNGVQNAQVSWNFNKFLIDEAGHWVRHFGSTTQPGDTAITNWILSPSVISGIAQNNADADFLKIVGSNIGTDINLSVNGMVDEKLSIELFAADGRLITLLYEGVSQGSQIVSINTGILQTGMYFVQARSAQRKGVQKLIVTR